MSSESYYDYRRKQDPYFAGKRCQHGCGTVAYDENAYYNHACLPEVMNARYQSRRKQDMATIIICDRCGQIATAKVAGGCAYEANAEAEVERFALCPNCSRELYDFLHSTEKDVRAIMAPFKPEEERLPAGPTQADTSRAAIQAEYGEASEDVSKHTRY